MQLCCVCLLGLLYLPLLRINHTNLMMNLRYFARCVSIFILLIPGLDGYAQVKTTKDSATIHQLADVEVSAAIPDPLPATKKISRKTLDFVQSNTLGETLSHIPGIQNAGFGPNSGSPMIRSLSGNRVKILQNGLAVSDLSGISPNLNVISDMDNLLGIDIYQAEASVRYGGKAIGGAIDLRDNTIPRQLSKQRLTGSLINMGGSNSGFKQAIDLNGKLGGKWSWHVGGMNRWNYDLRIPGNTKAPIAYDPAIDNLTASMAQVDVDKVTTRNLTLYPYISQFALDYLNDPQWGLSEADLYTFQEKSSIGGMLVANPKNPVYISGQPAGTPFSTTTVRSITDYAPVQRGIMPNSHSNSYAFNAGTAYLGKDLDIGIGFRRSYGYYGIPGFSLRKMPGHTHEDGSAHYNQVYLPINTRSEHNNVLMESAFRPKGVGLHEIRLNYSTGFGQDSELTGSYLANRFQSLQHNLRLEIAQDEIEHLTGLSGFDASYLRMKGAGEERYLPDNSSREYGFFTQQKISFSPLEVNLGYRRDQVSRRAELTKGYTPSRGLGGGKLAARTFGLDQYNASLLLKVIDIAFLKASYNQAERAPDVNELYAGNDHYAIMIEENGDDRLNKERAGTAEFGVGLKYKDISFSLSHYQTSFQNYLYLAHTGISRSGGFLVKEWRQADTKITVWEAEMAMLKSFGSFKINMGGYFDLVRNMNVSHQSLRDWAEGDYMPNMPTSRFGFSGSVSRKRIELNVLFDRYLKQRFLGKNINPEPPMPAYSLLSVRCSFKSMLHKFSLNYFLEGSNLLNVEARPQNSLLKYLAPLPGLNISMGIKIGV
ncbi:iron complex outermembrane recepter protein [Pedobacter terrae]|uniref:Iron complex outermembrane recepter protein n=2 Tax=Pedobacter terrae TaxID=405671 RepID=A0A1G7XDC4_9SPHI|nr:iron complex outermembrane recepter protein [Pedobacter terrae]